MTFVKSLLVYTSDEEYVCGGILTLLEKPTPENLASELFPHDKLDQKMADNPSSFPGELFDQLDPIIFESRL